MTSKHPLSEWNSFSEGQEETANYLSEDLCIHSMDKNPLPCHLLKMIPLMVDLLSWSLKILAEVHSPLHIPDGFNTDNAITTVARKKKKTKKKQFKLTNRVIIAAWQSWKSVSSHNVRNALEIFEYDPHERKRETIYIKHYM